MSEPASHDSITGNLAQLFVGRGEILKPKDIADVLGYSEETVKTWISSGSLRGFRIGREWRVVTADFLEDMAARSSLSSQPDDTEAS